MTLEQVFLKIGDTKVFCEKKKLIDNSEYFRAMLEGNFVESRRTTISLRGVDIYTMNIILKILSNELFPVKNEDVLIVLETACMLQFENIRIRCLKQIREILCPTNCLQIWRGTERLQIRPLFLHAKTMALEEFLIIRNTSYILDLSLEELCNYLGHIYLKTDTEFSVFLTAMNWWKRHNNLYRRNRLEILLKLLNCIDWPTVSNDNLKEMMLFPHIADNVEIIYILYCISFIKDHKDVINFSEPCKEKAVSLLNCKRRRSPVVPCILANFVQPKDNNKLIRKEEELTVIYYDKFKRKRFYQILDNNKNDILTTIFYDYTLKKFRKYFDFDGSKADKLDGFALIGHKECAFLYGGEYSIGRGDWQLNLWMYDAYRESWNKKSVLPHQRRHFQTCIVGDNLYIIGGTGSFRVIQENMFWYKFNEDRWSLQISLPFPVRQLKCCSFQNQLLVVNLSDRCGSLFNDQTVCWYRFDIVVDDYAVDSLSEYSIFSYKDLLYFKGHHLIEFSLVGSQLRCLRFKRGLSKTCEKLELVLCNNFVFTLYKYRVEDNFSYSLESLDLDSMHTEYVFQDRSCHIDIDGDLYALASSLKLFSFHHYSLVEQTQLINNSFA